jgi:transmembrane sensor
MSVTEFPDLSLAREEAASWIARLDRGLDAMERADLRRWCTSSPANARALRHLSELWGSLDVIKAVTEVLPDAAHEPGRTASRRAKRLLNFNGDAPRPARRGRPALAAGAVVALLLAGFATRQYLVTAPPAAPDQRLTASYATTVGEQRDVELADGSSLAINTGSLVEVVSLGGDSRELHLLHGEAVFTVAHDPLRPFRVRAGAHVVEAVGTEFNVRLHQGGALEVIVTEGTVRLLESSGTADLLGQGKSIFIEADGNSRVTSLDADALAARLAWRQGMIVFTGQPLSQALDEFARYSPTRFEITDAATRNRPVGGSVLAGDVDSLLAALHTNLGLEGRRQGDGSIQIGPAR